ncbi:type VI secretion system lipoprotein TssJ [Vibrio profundum]|uniref:type VI secretion system lipoprotein TssJ n=1 Tax=Vibrio profundum TaxID=2910247 RepID=UPI003D0E545B
MSKWLAVFSVLLLFGCSSSPAPTSVQYKVSINADKSINQYQSKQSNPVVVRLYQLTDQQQFKQLPFIDLYSDDTKLLGSKLVAKQVLPIIVPNTKKDITINVDKNTRYLAVLAEFANYQNSQSKSVTVLPTKSDQYFQLDIKDNKATIKVITPKSSWWQIF